VLGGRGAEGEGQALGWDSQLGDVKAGRAAPGHRAGGVPWGSMGLHQRWVEVAMQHIAEATEKGL